MADSPGQKAWRNRHRERLRAYKKDWDAQNVEKLREYRRAWKTRNREKERAGSRRRYAKNRLRESVRSHIHLCLKEHKAGRHWETLVGYTLSDLQNHLEALFRSGMSWDNYGKWHVDHIRPLSSFDFNKDPDAALRESWALSNLQPLWAHENWAKGSRYAA